MKNYFKKFSIMLVMSLFFALGYCTNAFAVDTTYTDNLIRIGYFKAVMMM